MLFSPHCLLAYLIACAPSDCDYAAPDLSVGGLHADLLGGDVLPLLRLLHHRLSIHKAKAVQVADCRNKECFSGFNLYADKHTI